ncbi:hypothetical protein OG302_36665 [Streptomyces sp. NBC_01283]|uniref:hypothetical protein n=1 Tax=Streptomyces sp. NBC_01283 TaxID=2903812 RepID=UPI00352C2C7F|nr:hypothetical protein OG302_36665 [Streptomyces sp. NBC_01283]
MQYLLGWLITAATPRIAVRKKATIGSSSGCGVCRLLFVAGGLVRSVIAGEPRVM